VAHRLCQLACLLYAHTVCALLHTQSAHQVSHSCIYCCSAQVLKCSSTAAALLSAAAPHGVVGGCTLLPLRLQALKCAAHAMPCSYTPHRECTTTSTGGVGADRAGKQENRHPRQTRKDIERDRRADRHKGNTHKGNKSRQTQGNIDKGRDRREETEGNIDKGRDTRETREQIEKGNHDKRAGQRESPVYQGGFS